MSTPGGGTIGSIRIEHTLSSGANGILLVGLQPALERRVAIRRLPGDLLEDQALVERFRREARLGARVHHPNVVAVLDSFAYRGDHYLILEFVDGPKLGDVLTQAGHAPPEVAVALGLEIARGLRELHSRGIVHANLTPERVLMSRWGTPKLRGLGRSREESEEAVHPLAPGPYTAPELARGEKGDARADVYSLAAILHEAMTGEPPSPGTGSRIAGIPKRLARLVARALSPDPDSRPANAEEMCVLLGSLTDEAQPQACRTAIAGWLYSVGSVQPTESAPLDDPATKEEPPEEESPSAWTGRTVQTAAAAAVSVIALALVVRFLSGDSTPEGPAPVPAVSSGTPEMAAEPAHVRFVVHPWAEVEVEGLAPFLTPRAARVELSPGKHQVVYRHPKLGTVKRQITVEPGEERVIRETLRERPAS